jgi:hypothetical protein
MNKNGNNSFNNLKYTTKRALYFDNFVTIYRDQIGYGKKDKI